MAGRPRTGRYAAPGRRIRVPIQVATVGLVLVLLALTVFAVTAAVTNARAADEAQRSATASELSERAQQGLTAQEDAADEHALEPAEGTRAAYEASHQEVRAALRALAAHLGGPPEDLRVWLVLHSEYAKAVEQLFVVAARSPDAAEAFEERAVDPYFDPLEEALQAEVQHHYAEAGQALDAVARSQELLLVATPVVFGVGLLLVGGFSVVLSRSRRETEAQADENRHQARHDALTGLPNRTLLRSRSLTALEEAAASGTPMCLMLLDLDRFKQINDTLGHHYGDLVLRALAERLQAAVPPGCTIARLGGDEFAVLLPSVPSSAAALAVAHRIQTALEDTVEADGVSLDVDASIGIVLSGQHGTDVDTLLQRADIAMYHAKARSLGTCVYEDALNAHSREQLGLLGELRRAMDQRELVLHYQPKVAVADGAFCGAEALLRWEHPVRGMVGPGQFIPAAEHTALVRPLTRYVLDAALAECRRWQDRGRVLQVAVNVSARNLLDDTFAGDVLDALTTWQVPASSLELEVTESSIMLDPERVQAVLARFATMGITLAIDDFGAGYTSMAHLRNLPVHELKIDRSLVAQMTVVASDALIVRSVIELAHNLGLRTVAEGVEDEATLRHLGDLGCDVAQGFHLARPLTAAGLDAWYAAQQAPLVVAGV